MLQKAFLFTRLVVTTVTFDEEDPNVLILDQTAEKDQKFCTNSKMTIIAIDEDFLHLNMETQDGILATRKFIKHKQEKNKTGRRKTSAPF